MKNLVIYALTYFLGACVACGTQELFESTPPYTTPVNKTYKTEIDEILYPFVAMFLKDCEARRTDCKKKLERIKEIKVIDMPDLNESDNEIVIGLCYDTLLNRRVHINRIIIDFSNQYLQALMYHELGHCMYNLDHLKQPDKIMSPEMPSLLVLMSQWEELVEELFVAIRKGNGP